MITVDDFIRTAKDVVARANEHEGDPRMAFPIHPWDHIEDAIHVQGHLIGPCDGERMSFTHTEFLTMCASWYVIGYELGRQQTTERST